MKILKLSSESTIRVTPTLNTSDPILQNTQNMELTHSWCDQKQPEMSQLKIIMPFKKPVKHV